MKKYFTLNFSLLKFKNLVTLFISLSCISLNGFSNELSFFVDSEVKGNEVFKASNKEGKAFQLFTHGRPGELLINGHWMNPAQIAEFLKPKLSNEINHLNIYGCEFAKGEKGLSAVKYLEAALSISISASDDLTGKGGDWDLEVGPSKSILRFEGYPFALQTCAGAVGGMLPGDDFDGDGVCNDLDYDDDNDGIVDIYEVNVNGTTCDPLTNFLSVRPTDWGNYSGGNTILTKAELALISDVNSGTQVSKSYASIPYISKLTQTYPSVTVSQIRIYNYTNSNIGNTSTPHVAKIDRIRLLNAKGQVVYEELNVIPTTITAGSYYGINISPMVEGVTSIEMYNVRSSTNGLGLRDVFLVGCSHDFDGDGYPNKFDTDSDNDGCADAIESNANPPLGGSGAGYKFPDLDGKNMVDISLYPIGTNPSLNTYGVPNSDRNNPIASTYDANVKSPECNPCSITSTLFVDYDGDSVADKCDLDIDNDGILNTVECPDFVELSPIPVTYLNLKDAVVLADPNPNDYVGPSLFAPNAATTFDGKCVDVRIDVTQLNTTLPQYFSWNTSPAGRPEEIKLFNGSGGNYYSFTVNYFECGTSTPVELTSIYTIEDIDGDCDWNADNVSDNPLCDNFTNNLVNDDWVSVLNGEIDNYRFSDTTLIYAKPGGLSTRFYSSGANNSGTSGITGIAPTGNTQTVYLTYKKASSFSFEYNTGQYGGIYMNFRYSEDAICDTDGDGLPDVIDLDSDADGCPDALEGGADFVHADLIVTNLDGGSTGIVTNLCNTSTCVDVNGVPISVGPGGQSLSLAQDSLVYCQPCMEPDTIITDTITCATCTVVACKTIDDIPLDYVIKYELCDAPAGYVFGTLDSTTGCVTIALDPTVEAPNTNGFTCIMSFGPEGIIDTTFIIIPPPILPDTVTLLPPACPTCPTQEVCATGDDIDTTGTVTYKSCGPPAGYTESFDPVTGCSVYTPNGSVTDTTYTCIVACDGKVCDTTFVIIPPPIYPDTVTTTTPACPTCPTDPICATADDVDSTKTITYTSCGAPAGYTETFDPVTGCSVYTPDGTVTDTVTTCIVACDGTVCDTTYIIIPPPIVPDTLTTTTPGCPTCPTDPICATADNVDSTKTLTFTSCGAPPGYTETLDPVTGCSVYTPDGTVTDTTYTCIVACDGTLCDTTYIIIPPPIVPDTVTTTTPACPTCPTDPICATADDVDSTKTITYTSCGAPPGYTETLDPVTGCSVYTPDGTVTDTVTTCIVACDGMVCDTTYIIIPPPIVPDTVTTTTPACPTCPTDPICATADDVDSTKTITYTSCGAPPGYTETFDPVTGCSVYTPDGTVTDTVTTCIVACDGMVCDTTYIIIPPPIVPDTVTTTTPACPTCPTDPICATADDVDSTKTITYTSCGAPPGYTETFDPLTGCSVYTPDGTVTDTVTTCIVACDGTVCDTTYIIIPPPFYPDTIMTAAPLSTTGSVSGCATADDVSGPLTFESCGQDPGSYTESAIDVNGCVTYTANPSIVDTVYTCIVAVDENGLRDTTYVIIPPPTPIVPDTIITIRVPCETCSVQGCATADDIPADQITGYVACDAPLASEYTVTGPDANGCMTFTSSSIVKTDSAISCVVALGPNGVADTTYIIIPIAETLLPVNLVHFNGFYTKNGIELNWKTASEVNFDKFIVEKRVNSDEFNSIGVVKGGSGDYRYIDNSLSTGINYYRLKMVDLDGTYSYSPSISINNEAISDGIIYPNPVIGKTFRIKNNFEIGSYKLSNLNGLEIPMDYSKTVNEHVFRITGKANQGMYLFQYSNKDGSLIFNKKLQILDN